MFLKKLASVLLASLLLAAPAAAQGLIIGNPGNGLAIGVGGSLLVGTSPITGTCTNGYVLFNNAGVLGCQAASAASLSIGGSITGSTAGYGLYVNGATLGQFAYGTGVFTALGSALNGSGAISATTSPAFVTPSWSGTAAGGALTLTTPLAVAQGGTGTTTPGLVQGTNITITGAWPNQTINSTGGGAVSSVANSDSTLTISPTTGSVVASLNLSHANTWGAVQTFGAGDIALTGATTGCATFTGTILSSTGTACGGGGGTLTVGTTATSGGASGQIMFDGGALLQESVNLLYASNILQVGQSTTAQSFRIANTWSSSGTNYEYGIFDWQTTANTLTIGTTNGGTGLARNLQFVVGGTNRLDYGVSASNTWTFNSNSVIAPSISLNNGNAMFLGANGAVINFQSNTASIGTLYGMTGIVVVGTGYNTSNGILQANGVITNALTYSTLPASPTAGQRAYITDATVSTFGTTVSVGGGSNKIPVIYNGTNWIVG